DNALVKAVARYPHRIALSATETDIDKNGVGHTGVFGGDEYLRSIGAVAGYGNFPTDDDGTIRKMAYRLEGLTSLSIVTAGLARGKPFTESEMGGSTQYIDFPGPANTVKKYSLSRVAPVSIVQVKKEVWAVRTLDGLGNSVYTAKRRSVAEAFASRYTIPISTFRDKVVVIGATAPVLQDVHATSTSPLMSGPEIQADAISTALRDFPLRGLGTFWNVVLIICLGMVVPLASLRMKPF